MAHRRYWLRMNGFGWLEVGRERYLYALNFGRFAAFSASWRIDDGKGVAMGRVTNGVINAKKYGHDREFLLAINSRRNQHRRRRRCVS